MAGVLKVYTEYIFTGLNMKDEMSLITSRRTPSKRHQVWFTDRAKAVPLSSPLFYVCVTCFLTS